MNAVAQASVNEQVIAVVSGEPYLELPDRKGLSTVLQGKIQGAQKVVLNFGGVFQIISYTGNIVVACSKVFIITKCFARHDSGLRLGYFEMGYEIPYFSQMAAVIVGKCFFKFERTNKTQKNRWLKATG